MDKTQWRGYHTLDEMVPNSEGSTSSEMPFYLFINFNVFCLLDGIVGLYGSANSELTQLLE